MRLCSTPGRIAMLALTLSAWFVVVIALEWILSDVEPSEREVAVWRGLVAAAAWFVTVVVAVRAGVGRVEATLATVATGSVWFVLLALPADDGDGLWAASLVLFVVPGLVVGSLLASWIAERTRAVGEGTTMSAQVPVSIAAASRSVGFGFDNRRVPSAGISERSM